MGFACSLIEKSLLAQVVFGYFNKFLGLFHVVIGRLRPRQIPHIVVGGFSIPLQIGEDNAQRIG